MSDKKQSKSTISHAFMKRVKLTDEQIIRLTIENMGVKKPEIKKGYDELVRRQEKSMKTIMDHMEKNFEREVLSVKRMLLDEHDPRKNPRPVFKPKWLPGQKRESLDKAAEDDARCIVIEDAHRRIKKLEAKFIEDRQQYLCDAVKDLQRHSEQFNRNAGNEPSHEKSQDMDRGYDR